MGGNDFMISQERDVQAVIIHGINPIHILELLLSLCITF
jgi:hypothetical protein